MQKRKVNPSLLKIKVALPRPTVHLGDDLTPYQLSDRENLKLEKSLIDNSIDRFDSSSDVL